MSHASGDRRRLRVGYVLKMYPRLSETFIVDELLAVEQAGVDVVVFSLRPPNDGRFHADLASVQALARYVPVTSTDAVMGALLPITAFADGSARLAKVLEFVERLPPEGVTAAVVQGLHVAQMAIDEQVDLLHAHFMTVAAHAAYIAHLVTDLPFTVTAHAKDVYRDTVDASLFADVAAAAEAVVTVCDANRTYITERLVDSRARIVRVYNGVAVDRLQPAAPDERDPGLVVGVGRLVEKKGFDVLLHACRVLLDRGVPVRCVIVGDGNERPRLLDLQRELGLEAVLEFAGAVPRHQALGWIRKAALLAAPCVMGSDGNRDALPTVMLEALALGVPVVATPIAGVPEIVEDGCEGLLVPEGDAQALADAIQKLVSDRALCADLGARGRAKAEDIFDRGSTVRELVDVFSGAARAEAQA